MFRRILLSDVIINYLLIIITQYSYSRYVCIYRCYFSSYTCDIYVLQVLHFLFTDVKFTFTCVTFAFRCVPFTLTFTGTTLTFTGITFAFTCITRLRALQFHLYLYFQVLHHADPVSASDHERGTRWSSWNWKNGNNEGSRSSARNHGLRFQLLRTDGLQGQSVIRN